MGDLFVVEAREGDLLSQKHRLASLAFQVTQKAEVLQLEPALAAATIRQV